MSTQQYLPRTSTCKSTWLLDTALIGFLATPVLLSNGLINTDIPNHLFRMTLLANLARGEPSSFYAIAPSLIPNLPLDLSAVLLGGLLKIDILLALQIIQIICVGSYYLTFIFWRSSCGRATSTWMRIAAALVIYSSPHGYGLLNYLMGLSLVSLMLMREEACLSALPEDKHSLNAQFGLKKSGIINAMMIASYFFSIFAPLIYIVSAFAMRWQNIISRQGRHQKSLQQSRLHRDMLSAKKALISILADQGFALFTILLIMVAFNPSDPTSAITFYNWPYKSTLLLAGLMQGNSPYDVIAVLLLLASIGLRLFDRSLLINALQIRVTACLALVALLLPNVLQGVGGADTRLILPIFIIFFALAGESAPKRSRKQRLKTLLYCMPTIISHTLIYAGVILRIWLVSSQSHFVSARLNAYRELAAQVPDSTSVYFIYDGMGTYQDIDRRLERSWLNWLRFIENPLTYDISPGQLEHSQFLWYLHMAAFTGRDVAMSGLFGNFWIRNHGQSPIKRFILMAPKPLNDALSDISLQPYQYVISHIDLDMHPLPNKRLILVAKSGGAFLYKAASMPTNKDS